MLETRLTHFCLKMIGNRELIPMYKSTLTPIIPSKQLQGPSFQSAMRISHLLQKNHCPRQRWQRLRCLRQMIGYFERLRDALLRLRAQGETPARMGAKTFGLLPCAQGRGERRACIHTFTPDQDQVQAIEKGMASERLVLIGPPGTGKTSTESALAVEYLLAGKTVLLTAHTNVALDSALKRLKQHCEQSGNASFFKQHRIIRVGISRDLADDVSSDITLQGIVDQQLGRLAQERDQLQQELSNLETEITHLSRDFKKRQEQWLQQRSIYQKRLIVDQKRQKELEECERQRLAIIANRLIAISEERQAAQEYLELGEQTIQHETTMLQTCITRCHDCEQALAAKNDEHLSFCSGSIMDRLVARVFGVTEQSLIKEVEAGQKQLIAAKLAVTEQERHRDAAYVRVFQSRTRLGALDVEEQQLRENQQLVTDDAIHLQKLAIQIEHDMQALRAGDEEVAQKKDLLHRKQQSYNQRTVRLSKIEDEQRMAASRIIANAQLIATTLTGITTSPYLRERMFDATIIDEVSMASLAVILVAVSRATRHVALFGDPMQLGPIIQLSDKRKTPLAAYWLGTDLFSHLGITLKDTETHRNQTVLLSQQLRMLPGVEYPCIIFDTTEGDDVSIGQFTSNTWGRHGIPHDATRLINVAHSRARDKLIYIANVDYIRQELYRKEHVLTKFVDYTDEKGHVDSFMLF